MPTKAELYAKAKELGIPGRSTMSKEELIKACQTKSNIAYERAYVRILVKKFKKMKKYLTKTSKEESADMAANSFTDGYSDDVPQELRVAVGSKFIKTQEAVITFGLHKIFYKNLKKSTKLKKPKKVIAESPGIGSKQLEELNTTREILLFLLLQFREILGEAFNKG